MGCDFDDIKRALPKLTLEQRAEIVQRCKVLGSLNRGVPEPTMVREELDPNDWLADAIGRVLINRGLATQNNVWFQLRMAAPPTYNRQSSIVRNWLLDVVGNNVSHLHRMRLGDTAVSALVTWLKRVTTSPEGSAGIGPKILMNNVRNIPQAIDAELPGYAAKGMLRLMMRR